MAEMVQFESQHWRAPSLCHGPAYQPEALMLQVLTLSMNWRLVNSRAL
jgi:hypothetical protein